jgi:UDP-N-acetylglucosamine/UDP-N-acetylgalactosamine diphosphorylase
MNDSTHLTDMLRQQLQHLGQLPLLDHLSRLPGDAQAELTRQLLHIDWAQVDGMRKLAASDSPEAALAVDPAWLQAAHTPAGPRLRSGGLSPVGPLSPLDATKRGEALLAQGGAGAILVAGGQASRLRCDGPKGIYRVGPVSQASLFELLLGRIRAIAAHAGRPIPLAIMTSSATDQATREYLAEHQFFGLPENEVLIFQQADLPALSIASLDLLLDAADHVAVAPDGHGGLLSALVAAGGLAWFAERGVQHVASFQVDNPLAMPLDPEFLGYHLLANAEFSTQVVEKQLPKERVGVVAEHHGQHRVIEYSDLSDELAEARDPDGKLRLRAGSIAVHAFALAFLQRAAKKPDSLPLHLARKAVPCLDASGQLHRPSAPNALKFERFIFDLMPQADGVLTVEIDPAEGFAPLKNPPGADADAPEHVQAAMNTLARRRCAAAGILVDQGILVELNPNTLTNDDLCRAVPSGHITASRVI